MPGGNTVYMDGSGYSPGRVNNRRKRTGRWRGHNQPDAHEYNKCECNSQIYCDTGSRCLHRRYVYNNGNGKSEGNNHQQNIHYMQRTSFSVTPANGAGNIVPGGTTYTWAAPAIAPARVNYRRQLAGLQGRPASARHLQIPLMLCHSYLYCNTDLRYMRLELPLQ